MEEKDEKMRNLRFSDTGRVGDLPLLRGKSTKKRFIR